MADIVVVDDNKDVLKMLEDVMSIDRHGVRVFSESAAALADILDPDTPVPELVVLDVMMPGIDGRQFSSRLRESPRAKNVPIIIITAHHELRQDFAGAQNVVDFIEKPFDLLDLRARITRALKLRK